MQSSLTPVRSHCQNLHSVNVKLHVIKSFFMPLIKLFKCSFRLYSIYSFHSVPAAWRRCSNSFLLSNLLQMPDNNSFKSSFWTIPQKHEINSVTRFLLFFFYVQWQRSFKFLLSTECLHGNYCMVMVRERLWMRLIKTHWHWTWIVRCGIIQYGRNFKDTGLADFTWDEKYPWTDWCIWTLFNGHRKKNKHNRWKSIPTLFKFLYYLHSSHYSSISFIVIACNPQVFFPVTVPIKFIQTKQPCLKHCWKKRERQHF